MSRIEELKKQMKELQKELDLEEAKQFQVPIEYGEEYFYWYSPSYLSHSEYQGTNDDIFLFLQNIAFADADEATKERDRRELQTRFKQFRDKCNGDWKADFSQHLVDKYSIQFNYAISDFVTVYSGQNDNFYLFGYFKNEEDAERAIELFGDEIKRLYVEE